MVAAVTRFRSPGALGGAGRDSRATASTSGTPTSTMAGSSSPALLRRPSDDASSTTPSAARSAFCGTRVATLLPTQTPGIEPSSSVPMSAKSMLPDSRCANAATHSRTAACATSVPTTRWGLRRKPRIRPMAISVPEPADVTPSTRPIVAPSATAAALCRAFMTKAPRSRAEWSAIASARSSTSAPVSASVPPMASSRKVSKLSPHASRRRSSSHTPTSAAGHDPIASHSAMRGNTVPLRKCRKPPTVLVTAAYARSVPTATTGWMPATRMSSGVISEPPPMPVTPTSAPTPRPKRMIAGSMSERARLARGAAGPSTLTVSRIT